VMWLFGILKKNWNKTVRRIQMEKRDPARFISEQLAGLGFDEMTIKESMRAVGLEVEKMDDGSLVKFADELMKRRFRIVIAGNKADKASDENLKKIQDVGGIVCSAMYEFTLKTATQNGYIKYIPGDDHFEILKELNEKQKKALDMIAGFMKRHGGTGVQQALNRTVFDMLDYIVVYPVEDENRYTDTKGNILPDAFLVKKGTTARELAYMIHTDIGKNYIYAVDARKKIRIAEDHELENGDVIKIVSSA